MAGVLAGGRTAQDDHVEAQALGEVRVLNLRVCGVLLLSWLCSTGMQGAGVGPFTGNLSMISSKYVKTARVHWKPIERMIPIPEKSGFWGGKRLCRSECDDVLLRE